MSEQGKSGHATSGGHDPGRDQVGYWNGPAGERWAARQEKLDRALEPFGAAGLRRLGLASGARVLDIGCGCGATVLALGMIVGSSGRVVGIDLSKPMLARARARTAHLANVELVNADASIHDFGERFDAAFSRFGVMFFADPVGAFRHVRAALVPEGELVFVCWRPFEDNEWLSLPAAVVASTLPDTPLDRLTTHSVGPFAFADPDRVADLLSRAGFAPPEILPFDAAVRLSASGVDEAVEFACAAGPVGRWYAEATQRERDRARHALEKALAPRVGGGGVCLAGAAWIIAARVGPAPRS